MSPRLLIPAVSVWILILALTAGNLADTSLKEQVYSDQYEDNYDIDEDRILDSSNSNELSEENLKEYDETLNQGENVKNEDGLEKYYTSRKPAESDILNDHVLEDEYGDDPAEESAKDKNALRDAHPSARDLSDEKYATNRFFLLPIMATMAHMKVKWLNSLFCGRSCSRSPPPPPPPPPAPPNPNKSLPPQPPTQTKGPTSPSQPVPTSTPKPLPTSPPPPPVTTIAPLPPPSDRTVIIIIQILTKICQIRDYIIFILGCFLQNSIKYLTESQYTSFYMILTELRNRPAIMQFILPHLTRIPMSGLQNQVLTIMQILRQVLPPHISCAASFWVYQLQQKKVRMDIHAKTCFVDLRIIHEVHINTIGQSLIPPYDVPRTTVIALGPILVNILLEIQRQRIAFSQEMFGIILSYFPVIPYDPILEQNIIFILEITRRKQIAAWQEIQFQIMTGDPYLFIKTIIVNILNTQNVARPIKEALIYIMIHLRPVPVTHVNFGNQIVIQIYRQKLNIELLLSFIVPHLYSQEIICLKNRFLLFVKEHRIPQSWMLTESEIFRHISPNDLLLAFLYKLQKKIPKKSGDIARTVTALLSLLIMHKQITHYDPGSRKIEFLTMLGYFDSPDFGHSVNEIYDKAVSIYVSKPNLQNKISQVIPTNCPRAVQCLIKTLSMLSQGNFALPGEMQYVIKQLNVIISKKHISSNCTVISIERNITLFPPPPPPPPTPPPIPKPPPPLLPPLPPALAPPQAPDINKTMVGSDLWVTRVILLPPCLNAVQEIRIYITKYGCPVIGPTVTQVNPVKPTLIIPSVTVCLKPPDIYDPFGTMPPDFKTNILIKITKIIGSTDLRLILGNSVQEIIRTGQCPTLGALVVTLLFRAKSSISIQAHYQLLIDIKNFLSSMNLVAVITLPTVLQVAKIYPTNGVIYSIINIAQPHRSFISVTSPFNVPRGMLVFVIIDPNKLREPINLQNPYEGLFPTVGRDTPGGQYVLQLKVLFTVSKISQLIPDFKPEDYASRGMLLMALLQKLASLSTIAAQPALQKILLGYVWAISIPAFYTKISYNEVIKTLGKQPQVKPDTGILVKLLPPPRNEKEIELWFRMRILLKREDLLDILSIPIPSPNTSQNDLLKMIIIAVLTSPHKFDETVLIACQFYNSKVFDIQKGSLRINWEIKRVVVTKLKVQVGQLIANVIDFDKLTNENKNNYNSLLNYLSTNSKLFTLMHDFPFKEYKTEGSFIQGLFKFLLDQSIISEDAKNKINSLLPHVMLTGPGAKKLETETPKLSPFNSRRSASQLEIDV